MPDIFGAPMGVSMAEADMRAAQSHMQQMAKGSIEIQQATMTLAMQQRIMQAMQQQDQGQAGPFAATTDLAGKMDVMANIAMESGQPDKAREYATAASTMRHQNAQIQNAQVSAAMKDASLVGSLMENVQDQASWQAANLMYQAQTGRPSRWANMPYSPQLVQRIISMSQTIKDKALTAAAQARTQDSIAETAERQARVPLIEAQTRYYDDRDIALRRAGATGKIPKSGEIKAITDLMKQEYDATDEHLRVLARPVAERMVDLMQKQHLTQSEAAHRAYQEARDRGDFGGMRRSRVIKGSGKDSAMALPISGGKIDRTKLLDNMWYMVQGQPKLYMDGQFRDESELDQIARKQDLDSGEEDPDNSAPAE
jgi:hypothetical protein